MSGNILLVDTLQRRRSAADDVQRQLNDAYVDLPTDGIHWRGGALLLIATAIGTLTLMGVIVASL
jgi:hypothetical protein